MEELKTEHIFKDDKSWYIDRGRETAQLSIEVKIHPLHLGCVISLGSLL